MVHDLIIGYGPVIDRMIYGWVLYIMGHEGGMVTYAEQSLYHRS